MEETPHSDKFKNIFRIPSARAIWHDYNCGQYFVTVCTRKREETLGTILDGVMYLTEVGQFLESQIIDCNKHYPFAEIPEYVIMPNHFHLIVNITEQSDFNIIRSENPHNETLQDVACQQSRLSVVIGGIKSYTSKFANKWGFSNQWQPRFYDRIIRDSKELNIKSNYIQNNIANWESDEFRHPLKKDEER